jgi:hypothetical protein
MVKGTVGLKTMLAPFDGNVTAEFGAIASVDGVAATSPGIN